MHRRDMHFQVMHYHGMHYCNPGDSSGVVRGIYLSKGEKLERSTRLVHTGMSSLNGLVCFTNCLLPQEDGKLVEKDLWIDGERGVILDAQVCLLYALPL